jgi:uncharacterized protein YecT (DUF1311 family)
MRNIIFITALFITQLAHSQSVQDMNGKSANDFQKTDAQLKEVFKHVMKNIPDDEGKVRVALQRSQEAWLKFRKSEGEYVSQQFYGGSMMDYYYYNALNRMTRDRINQLNRNQF